MKNRRKSKLLLSIFVDFLFIILFILIITGGFFISKAILYPTGEQEARLKMRTEIMKKDYASELSVGDVVFDTLTKRRLGEIQELEIIESGDGIYFLLTVDAAFTPRSKSLRTKNLWFYFAPQD